MTNFITLTQIYSDITFKDMKEAGKIDYSNLTFIDATKIDALYKNELGNTDIIVSGFPISVKESVEEVLDLIKGCSKANALAEYLFNLNS